jgi:hypothetical protein
MFQLMINDGGMGTAGVAAHGATGLPTTVSARQRDRVVATVGVPSVRRTGDELLA